MATVAPVNGRCSPGYTYTVPRLGMTPTCNAPLPVDGRCPSGFVYGKPTMPGLPGSCSPVTKTGATESVASTVTTAVSRAASSLVGPSRDSTPTGPLPHNGVCPSGYSYFRVGTSERCLPAPSGFMFEPPPPAPAAAKADTAATRCAPPLVLQNGKCVSTDRVAECPAGQVMKYGKCSTVCTPPLVLKGFQCVPPEAAPPVLVDGGPVAAGGGLPKEAVWIGLAAAGLLGVWWMFGRKKSVSANRRRRRMNRNRAGGGHGYQGVQ